MMRAVHLFLRLYPRAWRRRYEAEFLAAIDGRALTTQDAIDILAGAIDAWWSADVRRVTHALPPATPVGDSMTLKSLFLCQPAASRYSTRDALIGAFVMLGATAAFLWSGIALGRSDWPVTADILKGLAFPGSLALSMPFWLLKGQSVKAQLVLVGGTLALLAGAASVASMI
jgi:hypothetical protein